MLTGLVSAVTAGGERSGGSAPPRSLLGLGGAGEALPPLIILGCRLNRQREPSPPNPPHPHHHQFLCAHPGCLAAVRARTRARGSAESTRLLLAGVTVRAPTPSLSLSLSPPASLSLFSAAPPATAPAPIVDKDGGRRSKRAQKSGIRRADHRTSELHRTFKKGEYDPCGGEEARGSSVPRNW